MTTIRRGKHRKREQLLLAAAMAVEEDVRYDREALSTDVGRRSRELRDAARRLSAEGDIHGAHALFVEAAAPFPVDDPGAAAAAAWYDLGESFKGISLDRAVEHLLEAERLFRSSIASPSRGRATLRLARSHDALGQTLRRLALIASDASERDRLRAEAIEHLELACRLAERCEMVGREDAAGYHHNRGLVLRQRGRLAEALDAHRTALRLAERAKETLGEASKPFQSEHIRISLAQALIIRHRGTDLDEALRVTARVISAGSPTHAAVAHLVATQALMEKGQQHRGAARRQLSAVHLAELPFEHHETYLDLLIELGDMKHAAAVARDCVARALHARKDAMADHVADRYAEHAQRFAVREASIHVAEGRAIDAFLALENASGLRYFDAVQPFMWRSGSALFHELSRRKLTCDTLAAELEDMAARLGFVEDAHRAEAIELGIREFEQMSREPDVSTDPANVLAQMQDALRQAQRHPSPAAALRARAKQSFREGQTCYRAMEAANSTFALEATALGAACTAETLAALLAENEGLALLRLYLADRLLVMSVWLDAGRLRGACISLSLPDRIGELLRLGRWASDELPDVTSVLEQLDLSEVLPATTPRRHLVVLPSSHAARIPWAVAGPPGRTLLDRFDAISYLPVLTPLQGRQGAQPPRHGLVSLLPGEGLTHPTKFHAAAFSERLEGETQLWDEQADLAAAHKAARTADVVAFYTHGRHGHEDGGIRLVDGTLGPLELGMAWVGCERVELWACQTGVNEPTDWLTPPFVDEAFGLDIAFHRAGVRSTIGTLWKVPDVVTAYIVRWYRHELAAGCDPPTALVRAQRRWRDELIPKVRARLESASTPNLIQEIAAELEVDPHDLELDLTDSPSPPTVPEARRQRILDKLTHPKSWAGYRFVGVCDRRPTEPWNDEQERPLTPEEQARREQLLRDAEQVRDPEHPDEALQAELDEARKLADDAGPSPEQAVRVARLYGDRWLSSHRHNLLRGLAWLHEALAAPDLEPASRRALDLEAAWFWLELARGELSQESLRPLYPAPPVLLARVEERIGPYSAEPEARIIGTWARILQAGSDPRSDGRTHRNVGHPAWSAALERPMARYEGLRAKEAALALAVLDAEVTPEEAKAMVEAIVASAVNVRLDELFVVRRALVYAAALVDRFALPLVVPAVGTGSSPRELALHLELANARTATGAPADQRAFDEALEHDIGALEGAFWGYPSDDRTSFWMSSGTPGLAWHRVIGAYSAAKLRDELHDTATHFIASIQMGADLRIGVFNAWVGFAASVAEQYTRQRTHAWGRELFLQQLEDAALLTDGQGSRAQPYSLDPFRLSTEHLLEPSEEQIPFSITSYVVAETPRMWSRALPSGRTAAFITERLLIGFDKLVVELWSGINGALRAGIPAEANPDDQQAVQSILSLLDPRPTLGELEEHIRSIPEGQALVGAFLGPVGEIQMACVSRRGEALHQRVFSGQPTLGLRAAHALAVAVGLCREDDPQLEAVTPSRSSALESLRLVLEEGLQKVFPPQINTDGLRHLHVMAPGPLRGGPWGALRVRGRPIRDQLASVSLLPHVGFGRSQALFQRDRPKPHLVCALGVEDDDPGAAVIQTLRRLRPAAAIAEPPNPTLSTKIFEVDVIEEHAPAITDLRLYGSRTYMTLNATTEGIQLRGDRVYTTRNMAATVLPCCECVELWAATGSVGESHAIRAADRDAMPSLVRSFLSAGAAGVVDLAWPVPPLVQALVCEAFGLRRAFWSIHGSLALNEALRETEALLDAWRKQRRDADSVSAAFEWLDDARRRRVQSLGGDPALVVPLPVPSITSEHDPAGLIERCANEINLAAFRWWGS